MKQNERDQIRRIENMFEENYNRLDQVKKNAINLHTTKGNEMAKQIEMSQNLLFKTCEEVNRLVMTISDNKTEKPLRFHALDADYEEQVARAERELTSNYPDSYRETANQAFNSSFSSGRITSFTPDEDGGIDELMLRINEHIKRASRDDDEGGTFYVRA